MRKLITSGIGLFCGLLVIIMAFFIQVNPVTLETESFAKLYSATEDPYSVPDNYSGSSERDKYYGGDAYTGIQQAAAQAANNILALEETLQQTNENILAVNENLKTANSNLVKANENLIKAVNLQTMNLETVCNSISDVISQVGFFLMLAAGLTMIANNLNPFMDNLDAYLATRNAAPAPAVMPVTVPVTAPVVMPVTEPVTLPVTEPVVECQEPAEEEFTTVI